VFPQQDLSPEVFESLAFDQFWIQPMDGPRRAENTAAAVAFCLTHPLWRLSLQTHKMIGIP
jgi:organic radical activating enzyme